MALKITLKANERLIVGGAVLRSTDSCQLVVENKVPILRERDILAEKEANTPCRRIYFVIQLMYVDEANSAKYHKTYWQLVQDVVKAAPSTLELIGRISEDILNNRLYAALKLARKLIDYESEAMKGAGRRTT